MAVAVMAIATLGLLALPALDLIQVASRPDLGGYARVDLELYLSATRRWLASGEFYESYQLAGPYQLTPGDILYPPAALLLFMPFLVLPGALWWLLPLSAVAWVIWMLRPDHVVWPLMALCIAWPPTIVKIVTGNPVIWVVAAVALGCLYRWPAVLALLKPSLFPFALIGAGSRSWWVALGLALLASLPFGSLWIDWLVALQNLRGAGLGYSLQEVPMVLLPIIAAIPVTRWRTRAATLRATRSHS